LRQRSISDFNLDRAKHVLSLVEGTPNQQNLKIRNSKSETNSK
jgi:hypothetical protein